MALKLRYFTFQLKESSIASLYSADRVRIPIILLWVYYYNVSSRSAPDGAALMTTRTLEAEDPDLGKFLELLERDMAAHPEHIREIGTQRVARIGLLVHGVPVDLEDPLLVDEK